MMTSTLLLLLAAGCTGADPKQQEDTASEADPCAAGPDPALTIGFPLTGEFTPIEDGAVVGLEAAPQGGFGVSVSAQTTGLASAPDGVLIDALVETFLDGELSASFLAEEVSLYCQGDGTSLFWGVVVGFDSSEYNSANLTDLDGKIADLRVVATDSEGNSAEGELSVELNVTR